VAVAVAIRPPFEVRAKAAMPRSISPESRILTGVTSILSDGAIAWITPNWPTPVAIAVIANDHSARHRWCNLFEQPKPFATDAVFECSEPRGIAARLRQTIHEPCTNRIAGDRENDGYGLGQLQQRAHRGCAKSQNDIRLECNQFMSVFADVIAACGPSGFDPHVLPNGPAQ
jgi:hypothetical protein